MSPQFTSLPRNLAKWSIDDYHQMIEAGILHHRRVELLAGDIIEMAPEGPLHRSINDSVAEYLRELLRLRAKVYEAHPVTLIDSEPEPDLAIVKLPVSLYDSRHPQPSDIYWLIEVSDTTLSEDLTRKKKIYARAGIEEYWVINLPEKKLHRFFQPQKDDYLQQKELLKGKLFPLAFADVEVLVEKLFA